ncbi:MAG: 1-acyl-sn-glycerol-3-phosphate acyltransferase [Paramuribaculum sp.]|nr:1-acyl-sn-glycerol-3-phosphate acyltransferase [Paramuribaculum sp.]
MFLAKLILRIAGWKVKVTVPDYPKCIICVAPHTSNWDFIIGKLAYSAIGRKAGFLMKEAWFFFPLGYFFKAIGGIPVPSRRDTGTSLVETLTKRFNDSQRLVLAITPEGTRSLTSNWHTGFLHIAYNANIPIVLGAIDFAKKEVIITDEFTPTKNIDTDMAAIKKYYSHFTGRYPEKFTTQ